MVAFLAAHRDDHPHHRTVRPWFDALLAGDQPFAVPAVVWASFLRIATHRRIFEMPTPLDSTWMTGVGGCGDAPVEGWSPHSSEQSIPFDRDLINRRLAALTASGPEPARR